MKIVLLAIILIFMSCSGSPKKDKDPAKSLIGAPPTAAKDDPFFFVAMPEEAVPVATSGTLEKQDAAETPIATVKPAVPNANRSKPASQQQCFSCVQICPRGTSCQSSSDIICGWGVHPDRDIAGTRATAECDGALNLARSNPQWKRIEGECPIATCQ